MSHPDSARPPAVTVSCPHCNRRLRFSVPETVATRVRIQCASCESTFVLRRSGTGDGSSSQSALSQAELPLLVGLPEPPSAALEEGLPTSPLLRPDGILRRSRDGQTLAADSLLAGRYRVVRFLAQGGMGEVYEVEDLVLKERVAAKTVQPDMARDTLAIERFRREIQLARKVTHPNVCRIFDLSRHQPEAGGEPIEFLTMELLVGETLAARLRRGPLPPAEQLAIARQVLEGLDAAHRAGVIHRDLKPSNVVLVPDRDGVRAVVTDFGLARLESGHATRGATLTGADGLLGTPAYLSPEQVEGREITPAVDVYAMGIVLYEMATGRVPFESDSLLATAVKRLREAPTPPRAHTPGIDPRWEGVILRCLERNPADRYASAREVLEALTAGSRPREARETRAAARPAAPVSEPAARRPPAPAAAAKGSRRRLQIAVLAALILASFGVALYRVSVWKKEKALAERGFAIAPVSEAPRRAVAVLGFKNLSGDPQTAWLSNGLAEMIATELGATGDLRIVAGETVARTKVELKLADTDSLARDTLTRVRAAVGAEDVILGSYLLVDNPAGRRLRLDLRIQDAVAGETRLRIAETAAESELFDLVARVGGRLRQELGVGAAGKGPRSSLPSKGDAARLYTEGLDRLRRFEPVAARDLLSRAVEADPGNPLARSALAAAWAALGYDGQARQEARVAVQRSAGLPEEERLSIEGQYREIHADWPRAVAAYRELWALFPDDLEHGLRLASAQTAAGQTDAALATLDTLRTLPAPLRDDPRIDLAEATAAGIRADFKRQSAAATRARSKGTTLGTTLLAAEAALSQCRALRSLGQPDRALAACAEGRQLLSDLGNRAGVAEAATLSANALFDRGDLPGALALYQEALATYREIGNRGGEAGALNNVAVVHRSHGDLEQAQKLYQEALAIFRDLGSKGGEANALNNLAGVSFRRGELDAAAELYTQALALRREQKDASGEAYALDNLGVALRRRGQLAAARQRHEEALAIRRRTGQRLGIAASLRNLGSIFLDQGQLAEARKRFDEALAIGRAAGSRSETAYALFGAGEVAARSGRLPEAQKLHEEALNLRLALGEKGTVAESRLALAAVLLESGDAPRAGYLAREAVEELARQGEKDKEGLALSLSALAAGAQGDALAARDRIDLAVSRVAGGQDLRARLTVTLRALELGRITDPGQVEAALGKVLEEATRAGLAEQRLEAALAAAQLAARRGQAEGGVRAQEVGREAAALGFARIARRAGSLATRPAVR